jgi:hypothetical protein
MAREYTNVRGKTMGYLHDKRIQECKRNKQWATSITRRYKNVRGKNNGATSMTRGYKNVTAKNNGLPP